jgi:hypothetical protein
MPARTPPRRKPKRAGKRLVSKSKPSAGRFVGRDPSPVLERYPPRVPEMPAPSPVVIDSSGKGRSVAPGAAPAPPLPPSGNPLITLDRGFDIEQFSSMLGETSIRISVPREDLPEVLRRVLDFMGFGVYVYSIALRPGPSDLLKEFVVDLQRIDFSTEKGDWSPFVEKDPPAGASSSS